MHQESLYPIILGNGKKKFRDTKCHIKHHLPFPCQHVARQKMPKTKMCNQHIQKLLFLFSGAKEIKKIFNEMLLGKNKQKLECEYAKYNSHFVGMSTFGCYVATRRFDVGVGLETLAVYVTSGHDCRFQCKFEHMNRMKLEMSFVWTF